MALSLSSSLERSSDPEPPSANSARFGVDDARGGGRDRGGDLMRLEFAVLLAEDVEV